MLSKIRQKEGVKGKNVQESEIKKAISLPKLKAHNEI